MKPGTIATQHIEQLVSSFRISSRANDISPRHEGHTVRESIQSDYRAVHIVLSEFALRASVSVEGIIHKGQKMTARRSFVQFRARGVCMTPSVTTRSSRCSRLPDHLSFIVERTSFRFIHFRILSRKRFGETSTRGDGSCSAATNLPHAGSPCGRLRFRVVLRRAYAPLRGPRAASFESAT